MNDDPLDPRRVRYFMQVLENGSVRGAAEALAMDPSAVSRAIAQLEAQCGAPLLRRHGRGVTTTDAGELVASFGRRQEGQRKQLLAHIEGIRKVERGHIDIVAGEGMIDWLMRGSLRIFMRDHPAITVTLDVGSSDEIVERIVEERAHIGMLFAPPSDERLRSHLSAPHPIRALVLASHPLARLGRPLALADLLPYPGAALHRRFGVRQHIAAAEVSEGVRLNTVLTTTSFNAVGQFAAAGLGYALCPPTAAPVSREVGGAQSEVLVALPMKNPLLEQGRTHVMSRHGRMLPPVALAFLAQVMKDTEGWTAKQRDGRLAGPSPTCHGADTWRTSGNARSK